MVSHYDTQSSSVKKLFNSLEISNKESEAGAHLPQPILDRLVKLVQQSVRYTRNFKKQHAKQLLSTP